MSHMSQTNDSATPLEVLLADRRSALEALGVDPSDVQERALALAAQADTRTPGLLAVVVFAAASHDALLAQGRTGAEAVDAVDALISEPWHDRDLLRRWLSQRYGIDDAAPERAWSEAAVKFKARGEAVFGEDIKYEQERLDETASWVNITRCSVNDLLCGLGKPELIKIFCALDNIIAAEFDRDPAYGLKFEQVTTIGRGSDKCRFHFTRTDESSSDAVTSQSPPTSAHGKAV